MSTSRARLIKARGTVVYIAGAGVSQQRRSQHRSRSATFATSSVNSPSRAREINSAVEQPVAYPVYHSRPLAGVEEQTIGKCSPPVLDSVTFEELVDRAEASRHDHEP